VFHKVGDDVPEKLVALLDPRAIRGACGDDDVALFAHALDATFSGETQRRHACCAGGRKGSEHIG